jgi:hypothetical protein
MKMIKTASIFFTDRNNSGNAFHKLETGRSLLAFSEFDFSFFWETAIDCGRQAKKTGQIPKATAANARAAIARAHPFIAAGSGGDYADVVIDCIIEYICRSERMSEDELWMRCIASKIPYEIAIFKRISEYKTYRASNAWTNISGLQKYVRDKIDFIYGGERLNSLRCHNLKEYFDLSYSITANECGIPSAALPTVRVYNPCLAPSAAFAVSSSAAKNIYKRLQENLLAVPDLRDHDRYNTAVLEDKFAVECYSYMNGFTRPHDAEEDLFSKAVENLPEKVYVISSLKGIIDLEFDVLSQTGIAFKRCEKCGRFFLIPSTGFAEMFCDRIGSSGKTCREQSGFAPLPQVTHPAFDDNYSVPEPEQEETEQSEFVPFISEPVIKDPPPAADDTVVDKVEYNPETNEALHIRYGAPKREYPPRDIPAAVERRGQTLYNSIYKRVGKSFSENEFREWSQYLSNMKRNVKTGEGSLPQLEQFLDYSEKMSDEIKRAAKQKRYASAEPVARLKRFAEMTDNMHAIGDIPFPSYAETATIMTSGIAAPFDSAPAPIPKAEVIHPDDGAVEKVHELNLDSFTPFPTKGNVKIKDETKVEIDGRQAVLGNPVWERVERE